MFINITLTEKTLRIDSNICRIDWALLKSHAVLETRVAMITVSRLCPYQEASNVWHFSFPQDHEGFRHSFAQVCCTKCRSK